MSEEQRTKQTTIDSQGGMSLKSDGMKVRKHNTADTDKANNNQDLIHLVGALDITQS